MTDQLEACRQAIGSLDARAMSEAMQRWDTLTKPRGSLGRLESLACQVAGITGLPRPRLAERIAALGRPTLIVMEGGYAVAELADNVEGFLSGF